MASWKSVIPTHFRVVKKKFAKSLLTELLYCINNLMFGY